MKIPEDVYDVFIKEWGKFVKSCIKKGKGENQLEEFDKYFEEFGGCNLEYLGPAGNGE